MVKPITETKTKNFARELDALATAIIQTHDYQKAASLLISGLTALFQAQRGILFFEREYGQGMEPVQWHGLEVSPNGHTRISRRHHLWNVLKSPLTWIKVDEALAKYLELLIPSAGSKSARACPYDLIIPLLFNEGVVGAVILGGVAIQPSSNRATAALRRLSERAGGMLLHTTMHEQLEQERAEKELLLEVSKRINSSLQLNDVFELITENVKNVVPYDKAAIMLLDPDTKELHLNFYRAASPLPPKYYRIKMTEGICGWVARKGHSVIVPDVRTDTRYVKMYHDTLSELAVPLKVGTKVIGVFNLESNIPNAYDFRAKEMVKALASQAAIAIQNARLYGEMLKKRELEHELTTAHQIQQALLPKRLPNIEGYRFAALNIPSKLVGGDLYDFIQFYDGRVGIAIGDVSGKGAPGAILMANLFASYRGLVRLGMPLEQMFAELNNILKSSIAPGNFATFFFGILVPMTSELYYVNAGHNPPILLRANNQIERLETGGTVLGFMKDLKFQRGYIKVAAGDLLYLYTDGVTEAIKRNNVMFGEDRVIRFLIENRNLEPEQLVQRFFDRIKDFTGLENIDDDLTMSIMKIIKG